MTATKARSWRDVLRVHPAAELFPLMSPDELRALGEDIKANGLKNPLVFHYEEDAGRGRYCLLDGRNRLDAMERVGLCFSLGDCIANPTLTIDGHRDSDLPTMEYVYGDPYAFVISANVLRRHLTVEQRRDLIAKLLKASPDKSNRQIAETVKASPTTVGTVRKEMEHRGDVSKLDTRTDTRGRNQPAQRTKPKVSNRQIGRTLGADHQTINKDVGDNSPATSKKANQTNGPDRPIGENSPPRELSDPPTAAQPTPTGYTALVDAWFMASPDDRRRFLKYIGVAFIDESRITTGDVPAPAPDDDSIPAFLQRGAP